MSVPPADLSDLREFDTPDVVKSALRRFRVLLLVALVAVAAAAGFTGYKVDQARTNSSTELLHRADELQENPQRDDPLPYFSLHNDLAAAAHVESCSLFAVRMTERFLPEGWHFDEEDVATLRRDGSIDALHMEMGMEVPSRWQC